MAERDMGGKVCLVTGANAGIGKGTALELAERDAHVIMVARSRQRGEAAQAEIKEMSGEEQVDLLLADLSVQDEVRGLAAMVKDKYDRLDVLINNAGVIPQERKLSADGLEMQLAVNHLAPFLLTNLLLPPLKASAPARIITVSSDSHRRSRINFADMERREKGYHRIRVYGETKMMNVLFTAELARRLEGSGVTANSLHPGVIDTQLYHDYMGRPSSRDGDWSELRRGASTPVYLAVSEDVAGVSGKHFVRKSISTDTREDYDAGQARRLWQVSARLTGVDSGQ